MWACDPTLTSTILNSYNAAGPLFMQTLQTVMAAHCALVGDHLWPADAIDDVIKDPYYDFIVVGSGSSGSVVANRLSEVEDWKVLLVEAGGNPTLATEVPNIFYSNIGTEEDWGYLIEQQDGACKAFKNGQSVWPRGKVLGGCSSINAMFYVRANKQDYDEWALDGNYGWRYDDVLPYFKKSENFSEPLNQINRKYHSTGGYLHVQRTKENNYIEEIFLQALNERGLKISEDINGSDQIGATRAYSTIKDGIRHSTARAFLSPIKNRKNLHVIKNALATKILFEDYTNKVKGIVIQKDSRYITVNVKKEIIVSAGTINTPQLLILSGIGPQKHLNDLNINVRADLPVGENLQDHLFVPIFFTTPGNKNSNSLSDIVTAFKEYILTNKGPLSSVTPHSVIAFLNTSDITVSTPDIQYHFVFFNPKSSNLIDMFDKHRLNQEVHEQFLKINENNSILLIYTTLLKPKSRGTITLKSKNPNEHPIIRPNYLTNIEDVETTMRGVKFAASLNDTESFQSVGLKLHWFKLRSCMEYVLGSNEYMMCMIRAMTFTLYHPTSTAKMAPNGDNSGVLDPELRVREVTGLRVIDASIMPNIVRGNTNAVSIMIGEKGADMIKRYWFKKLSPEL